MEQKYTEEERDVFALSFLIWYLYAEDAQIYKSQEMTAGEMLDIYKSRPYLKTDQPQEN